MNFNMNKISKIFLLLILIGSCKSKNCSQVPNSFSNFNSALSEINKSNFEIEDKVNTSKSSWVKGASFFSCDSEKGFFILKTNSEKYIHQNVPIELWQEFKSTNSFGSFYTKKIKGRYQLKIK